MSWVGKCTFSIFLFSGGQQDSAVVVRILQSLHSPGWRAVGDVGGQHEMVVYFLIRPERGDKNSALLFPDLVPGRNGLLHLAVPLK